MLILVAFTALTVPVVVASDQKIPTILTPATKFFPLATTSIILEAW